MKDIDSARHYFKNVLGFAVPDTGKLEPGMYSGTISASVYFPDFSSIELLSVKDTGLVKSNSFITSFLTNHKGVRSYSLSTSSADSTLSWFKAQGLKTDSIHAGRTSTEKPKGWNYDDGGAQWRDVSFNRNDPPAYLPGFVECHTHLVFAGHRAAEFEMRNQGVSYQEIAKRGGGILSTMKHTREASAKQLAEISQKRVDEFVAQGVTSLEIKSGYGLDLKNELKMLKTAKALTGPQIVTAVPRPPCRGVPRR
ncbi:MAG: hypothetical protein EOO01_26990, partial [Chitinophagaceae bacterium]